MAKTLYERVRNSALSAGLIGAMALGGCLRNDGPVEKKVPYQSNRTGLTAEQSLEMWHDYRQSINLVTFNDPRGDEVRKSMTDLLVALSYKDGPASNDGTDVPRKITGVRKIIFDKGENMLFCLYHNAEDGEIRFILRGLDGVVYKDNVEKLPKGANVLREAPKNLDYGLYFAECYRDGKLVGVAKARVFDPKGPVIHVNENPDGSIDYPSK